MKGLFVTGTDTGVGKTVAAAALLQRYRGVAPLRYWKPIQTGIEIDDDTATVRRLGAAAGQEIFEPGVRLEKPVSPHLAARWAGTRIDLAELRAMLPDEPDTVWIVEGAGGLLVPINEWQTMADWIAYLSLPVVVVARSGLGHYQPYAADAGSSANPLAARRGRVDDRRTECGEPRCYRAVRARAGDCGDAVAGSA